MDLARLHWWLDTFSTAVSSSLTKLKYCFVLTVYFCLTFWTEYIILNFWNQSIQSCNLTGIETGVISTVLVTGTRRRSSHTDMNGMFLKTFLRIESNCEKKYMWLNMAKLLRIHSWPQILGLTIGCYCNICAIGRWIILVLIFFICLESCSLVT